MWWCVLFSCLAVTQAYIPPQHLFKGDNATLECGDAPYDAELLEWLLPTNEVVSETNGRFIVGGENGQASLTILELLMEDNGQFRCIYRVGSSREKRVELVTLKVKDTYIKELEDWQANATRGAISAAAVACFFASICAIHKYRWRPPVERRSSSRSSVSSKTGSQIPRAALKGVDNPALSEEDTVVVESAM